MPASGAAEMTEAEVAQLKRDTARMALDYATAGQEYDKLYDYLCKVEAALERLEYLEERDETYEETLEQLETCNEEYREVADELRELKKNAIQAD